MNLYKNFKEKIALSGFTVLGIGIALLVFTFANAYVFLAAVSQIPSTQDLAQNFGEAMAWLIATSIRVMYLGVMGWIASLITIRGVSLVTNAPKAEVDITRKSAARKLQKPQQAEAEPEKEAKPEVAPTEPELIAIPLEEMEQQQQPQGSQASP